MLYHSWRWFGESDPVSLMEVRQTGAYGVVSALHQIPTGEVWPIDAIRERKNQIEMAGLSWSVVESVPVHEDIKRRTGDYKKYTDNYVQTILNLGKEGINTLCYNFMPVLDWSRTNLKFRFSDGAESLYFNYAHFAAIDMFVLQRKNAAASYPKEVVAEAETFFNALNQRQKEELQHTFLLGFPGSGETLSLEEVKERLNSYSGIDNKVFKQNLFEFLKAIVPAAEQAGVKLAIHPDDPPFALMGLPRIVSTISDARDIVRAFNSPNNGFTFCTGSFGASVENDLPTMAKELSDRINFVHLRNVSRDVNKNFHENYLLEGDIDMYSVMKTIILEDNRRMESDPEHKGIPVRPDHGARILDDDQRETYPGYSLYGRLKSLAEIRGLEIGIRRSIGKNL